MSTLLFHRPARAERAESRAAGATLAGRLQRTLRATAQRLRQWRATLRARDEIATLDAATLRDIGLYRSEADSVAAELHGLAIATRRRVLESRIDPRPT